ncbi:hypothetical protein [Paenibacillus sp. FSL L8-0494]|uniref:hypothetical protein n=1 Tax=Paenibacillus sp. FSL L8-0494 TaxID=2975352 RepID=UPI0030F7F9EF
MGIWSFKEAAEVLELAESSARRWVYSLENAGYQFGRKEKRRKLTDEDMIALLKLKLLSQRMNLEEACAVVSDENINPERVVMIDSDYEVAEKEFEEELFKLDSSIFWKGGIQSIERVKEMWTILKQKEQHS